MFGPVQSQWITSHTFLLQCLVVTVTAVSNAPKASWVIVMHTTRCTHAHQVPHAEHMEMAKLEALATRSRAVLRLSVYESASKVNRSGGDAQVVSCCHCLVIHPFVEQLINRLPYIWTRSGVVFYPRLDLHAIVRWHPNLVMYRHSS